VTRSSNWEANPVKFPPGCDKLFTSPVPTGSTRMTKAIGIVLVAFFAAWTPTVADVTMTSTLSRTSSRASVGSRSGCPSAHRYSISTDLCSIQPRSRRPRRNADAERPCTSALPAARKPIRGTAVVCAPATVGASMSATRARRPMRRITVKEN
jgi:hypothetical protein